MSEDIKKEYGFEDETDWKDLLTNPSRWFGVYYLLLLFGIVAAGLAYLNNMNDIYKAQVDNSVLLIYEEDEEEKNNEYVIETKFEEMAEMGAEKEAKLSKKLNMIQLDNTSEALLLKAVTSDLKKVVITLMNDDRWKNNYEIFYGLVTANLPHNGFNSDVTELSKDQILSLHKLLNSHLSNDISDQESSI